jgi:hypothetical protein
MDFTAKEAQDRFWEVAKYLVEMSGIRSKPELVAEEEWSQSEAYNYVDRNAPWLLDRLQVLNQTTQARQEDTRPGEETRSESV